MPIDFLVLSAAFLSGLLGGAHCTLMCGGIATSLAAKNQSHPFAHALSLNSGRILSYTIAGLLAGSIGALFVGFARAPALPIILRSMMGIMLMLIALRMVFPRQFAFAILGNSAIWRLISGLKSKLPQTGLLSSFTLGALWGWLPCGLSTSILLAAWLEASPLHSSLMMLAFGLGTLPLMTSISYSGSQFARFFQHKKLRNSFATLIFLAGLLTALAPLLIQSATAHSWLQALGCRSII
jgi:sulfite exporter TauE/SafE